MDTPDAILFPILGGAALALALAWPFAHRRLRRVEADARAAEADADKARALLAASPDASFMFEAGTGNEFCSRRLARWFDLADDGRGVRLVDVLGRLEAADAEALMRAVTQLRADGTRFETALMKDGGLIAVAGSRARDAQGRPIADAIWFRPVPETAQNQKAPETAQNQKAPELPRPELPAAAVAEDGKSPAAPMAPPLSEVLNALTAPVAVFAADGRLQACNAACARLWRVDAPWLETGPSLGDILEALRARRRLPEVTDFRAYKAEQAALLRLTAPPPPVLMHLPDDTVLSLRVHPRAGAGGQPAGAVFVYDDVTDSLALKSSLKTATRVQDVTLDNLQEGVAVFGADGRLKLANREFFRLWALDAAAFAADAHLADFIEAMRPFRADIEDWPAFRERLAGRLLGRRAGRGRIERADGTALDYATVPLPDGAVLLGYLDVTAAVENETALLERAQAFEEAARLKSQFIANVSHEIRTPLTSVIGFAEVLAAGHFGALSPRQADYARHIFDSARGLMTVVDDILDLASIEAGALTLNTDAVDVHAMLVSVLGLVRERARHRELRLEFDVPPDIGWVQGDRSRLSQVLFHLLSNAIAFTPMRGGVRLSATRTGDNLILEVADTGIGIPLMDQDRVLRPFEKVVPIRAAGTGADVLGTSGAGLGLTLVRRLIEMHGGAVDLKSVPNRGTAVTCRLPAGGAKARDAFQL